MSRTYDSLIRGELVLPDRILADGWVAVSAGRIAGIGEGEPPAANPVLTQMDRLQAAFGR